MLWLEMARVGFFHDDHARVAAKFPRELTLPHVHGKNFFRAALQQTIRETAGGCAQINRGKSIHVDLKMFERVFEFVAAATDEFIAGLQNNFVRWLDRVAWFFGGMAIDANLAGENEALGFFAAVAKAAFDEGLIETGHVEKSIAVPRRGGNVNHGFAQQAAARRLQTEE